MKYLVKILLTVISGSLILGLLAVIIFLLNFDPNDYKTDIGRWVKTMTGREFIIKGDLTLTLFPWLGIKLTQVSLANTTHFDSSVFASIDQVQLRVKVMPLFKQKLEVDTIVLDQMDLRLQRNTRGQTNWADLVALIGNQSTGRGNLVITDFKLNGLIVTAATVVWEDQLTLSNYRLSQLNLSTSVLTLAQPFNCHLQMTMESNMLPWRAQLNLSSLVYWNVVTQHYRFESLQLAVKLASSSSSRSLMIPPRFQQFSLTSQLTINLTQQSLKWSALRLQLLPVILTGEVQFKNWYTVPMFTGQLQLVKLNLAALFPILMGSSGKWWQTMVKTVAMTTQFEFKPEVKPKSAVLSLKNLQIRAAANHLRIQKLLIDFTHSKLSTEELLVQGLGIKLKAKLQINQLFSQPLGEGEVQLVAATGETIFRHLSQFGITSLSTLPPRLTVNPISLATQFKVSIAEIVLSQLLLQVGQMQLHSPQIIYRPSVQTLQLTSLTLQILNLVVSGQLTFEPLFPETKFHGKLTVAEFNPRDWLSRLGLYLPKTADGQVFNKMAGVTTVEGGLSHLNLDLLTLQLDQSKLQARVRVQNFSSPVTNFEGVVDDINVDRYLPPPSSKIASDIKSKTKINSTQSIQQLGLWLTYLHTLKLTGQLRVSKLQIGGGEIHNALLKITAPSKLSP